MRGSKNDMQKTSFDELGVVLHETVWNDIHVAFETYQEAFDGSLLHKGGKNDRCQCPHWGYILKGQMRVIYADHEEVVRAGDAFYIPPDHNAVVEAGTESIEFSPNGPLQKEMEIAVRNLKAMRKK